MNDLGGSRVWVTGVVQGVGFRPFVYGIAKRHSLAGWVRNTSAGVEIEVDGPPENLQAFLTALRREAPPLARIDEMRIEACEPHGYQAFEIVRSESLPGAYQPVSPDIATCPDCLRELSDPHDRRYRYPFINCTHCGPRFTIIEDIPYDRPNTTMAPFPLCADCSREYGDPLDRRFHAQPVACPTCGPHLWLQAGGARRAETDEALHEARRMLRDGAILAIRGIGGFHLACDATNRAAVVELRRRKLRVDKPFAVMLPDLRAIEANCLIDEAARTLLESRERPIVVAPRRSGSAIAREVAPGQDSLGVMLPYSPLHHLLLERAAGFPEALVMTSGNLSEEPIAARNDEASARLGRLADAFLLHDREIGTRCDDSVLRAFEGQAYPVRRSRGYAPVPVRLPWEAPPILAAGAELKNTFCLTRGRHAFLSHHIGDLQNYETLAAFEDGVAHYERLFRVQPEIIAHDLHPDYLATRYALDRAAREGLQAIAVQHHHAHIAACMAEHSIADDRPVIGVAFDGTGYGDDGAIWGGEFLLAQYTEYRRAAHLAYVPMPGGDAAVHEPWRLALAWLQKASLPWDEQLAPVQAASLEARAILGRQLELGLNAPLTSSIGRLFDAVAALSGVRQCVNYEAQAAIELETQIDLDEEEAYPFEVDGIAIDPVPVIRAVVADVQAGVARAAISAKFHNGVAGMVVQVCHVLTKAYGVSEVALSGGVWQNMALLERTVPALRRDGFTVLLHRQVPANDGGLALGQAAVAARRAQGG
ncbi:MAG TPA: carbamoyltransferase HypF [Anaerolineales bacterium]|nr:carbamoyltransferase HypF [Anaerolineales bacterium]